MVAALKEIIVESDDENEEGAETENDGPLYQLFDALYNETNATGMHTFGHVPLCSFFLWLTIIVFAFVSNTNSPKRVYLFTYHTQIIRIHNRNFRRPIQFASITSAVSHLSLHSVIFCVALFVHPTDISLSKLSAVKIVFVVCVCLFK